MSQNSLVGALDTKPGLGRTETPSYSATVSRRDGDLQEPNQRSKIPADSVSVSSQFHRQPPSCFQVSSNT
jgi:hypothetical protein